VLPQIITAKAAFEPAGSSTVWHSHDLLQIGLMRTGTVRIEFPQEAVEVSAGGFFAIAPRHLHRITDLTDITIQEVFAELTDQPRHWASRAVQAADFSAYAQASVVASEAGSLIAAADALLRHAGATAAGSALVADGLLVQLLVEAATLPHQIVVCSERSGRSLTFPVQFLDAIRLIERSYHDPDTTVASLAGRLHLHRSALFRLFRRHLGYGPDAFLTRYRLDRARELLGRPDRRIGEVAYAVGFRDPATFSRAVRRHLGLTPSEVRRAMRAR